MMNYMKSEFYRVSRSRGIYFFVGILTVIPVAFNFVLYFFGKVPHFPYSSTSFSYSNVVANPMLFCVMGAVMAFFLYEGNRKNGNLKNTVSFGISRTQIFAGECLVASVTAILAMVVVLVFYIASAVLLLEQTGPVELADLLTEIPAVLLLAIASLISAIVFLEMFDKDSVGVIAWITIWMIIPKIVYYLGMRFAVVYEIAMKLPDNFFGISGMVVNTRQCVTAWETAEGMLLCVGSGAAGIVIFSIAGIVLLRHREL